MRKIIIACSKDWFLKNQKKRLKKKFILIVNKEKLKFEHIKKINPSYIFFPHWSNYIPRKIYENFNCIIFHTSHLPYGRGGSPIQNLIRRGFKKTEVCAVKVNKKLDAGHIYCREKISLDGDLDKIFHRISIKILKMINLITFKKLKLKEQVGKVYTFKRLKPSDSNIYELKNFTEIYNIIRSVDHKDYPKAFIKTKYFKIEFSNAKLLGNKLSCNVNFLK